MKTYFWKIIILLCAATPLVAQESANIIDIQRKIVYRLEKQANSFSKDTSLALGYATLAKFFVDESTDSLIYYEKKARELANKYNFKKGIAYCESAIGVNFREQGSYSKAIYHFLIAFDILENIDKKKAANALSDIGTVYTYAHDYKKAIEYHKKSNLILNKLHAENAILDNNANIGNAYLENNQPNKALPYFLNLERIFDEGKIKIDDISGHKCINYINLCTSYLHLDQLNEAKRYEVKAMEFYKIINGIAEEQYISMEFIKYYVSKKQYDEAVNYMTICEKLTNELGQENKWRELYFYKYKIKKGLNQVDSALIYHEKYIELKDKIGIIKAETEVKNETSEHKNTIENLQIEKQAKNFQILIGIIGILLAFSITAIWMNLRLRKKNKEISEAMLLGQTTERQRVAADLHDNLGSTLSSIKWSLQAIDKSKMDTLELEVHQNLSEMLEKAYNDVRFLSHNLLPEEFEKQGLVSSLKYFVRKINQNSVIKFELNIDENLGRFDKKIEFELYSICLELVTNILKHSKATEAKIELSRTEKQLKLIVSDNGIGTFKNDSDGKGMKNVKARVESLNGTWSLQNTHNQGVTNEILIPV